MFFAIKDYVPDGLSDFAEALANPIKYQSELEKRSEQLAVLMEDGEPTEEDASNSCKCIKSLIPFTYNTSREFHFENFIWKMLFKYLLHFTFSFILTNFSFRFVSLFFFFLSFFLC